MIRIIREEYISAVKVLIILFTPGMAQKRELKKVIKESQQQMKAMITKLNSLIQKENPLVSFHMNQYESSYAHDLVRERHLAKAVKNLCT